MPRNQIFKGRDFQDSIARLMSSRTRVRRSRHLVAAEMESVSVAPDKLVAVVVVEVVAVDVEEDAVVVVVAVAEVLQVVQYEIRWLYREHS